jgi:hypothetical protein
VFPQCLCRTEPIKLDSHHWRVEVFFRGIFGPFNPLFGWGINIIKQTFLHCSHKGNNATRWLM